MAKIRDRWKRPFLLKGILNLEDVERARDSGVDGIILGSHGGRQTENAVSALDILPQARSIVGPNYPLYMSGGVRRGTDILKARALGADVVLTGRATLQSLCAYGAEGVAKAIDLLESEMTNEIGQLGVPSLEALTRDVMVHNDELPQSP